MLKMTESPDESVLSKNNGSKLAFNRNNISRLASGKNDGDYKVDGFDSNEVKHAKKSEELKSQKLSKSQKSAKSGKKLLKSGNSPNFDTKKAGQNFLTFGTRETFNYLQLTFTKASIFWYLI